MVLVGLGAAGRAGNASATLPFLLSPVEEALREGKGEARALVAAEEEAQGV